VQRTRSETWGSRCNGASSEKTAASPGVLQKNNTGREGLAGHITSSTLNTVEARGGVGGGLVYTSKIPPWCIFYLYFSVVIFFMFKFVVF